LTTFQGGIHVVAAACWPAEGVSGGKIIAARMGYIDVFPTLMAVAGFKGNPKNELDGINVLPAIKGGKLKDRNWFTYEDQTKNKIEDLAINTDLWKLVVRRNAPDLEDKVNENQLFQIKEDPSEKLDVSVENPEKVKELLNVMNQFYNLKSKNEIERFPEPGNGQEPVLIPNWQPQK
jgi:arylsulfatase A-like enzyme